MPTLPHELKKLVYQDSPKALRALKANFEQYTPITDTSWEKLQAICSFRSLAKNEVLYPLGKHPKSFAFVFSGLLRVFVTDSEGKQYNKNFFESGSFPGAMRALLLNEASQTTIDALEPSIVLEIDFLAYRALLLTCEDLKLFQIYYLEKNWLLAKDARETEIVQQDASQRYQRFLTQYPTLAKRLPQYHIASHLGVTPTQLSRIRKNTN